MQRRARRPLYCTTHLREPKRGGSAPGQCQVLPQPKTHQAIILAQYHQQNDYGGSRIQTHQMDETETTNQPPPSSGRRNVLYRRGERHGAAEREIGRPGRVRRHRRRMATSCKPYQGGREGCRTHLKHNARLGRSHDQDATGSLAAHRPTSHDTIQCLPAARSSSRHLQDRRGCHVPEAEQAETSKVSTSRPTSLLSCLSQRSERVIARRMAYTAIKYGILHPNQAGALPKRSAVDNVVSLLYDIEKALGSALLASELVEKPQCHALTNAGVVDTVMTTQERRD